MSDQRTLWARLGELSWHDADLGISLDLALMRFEARDLAALDLPGAQAAMRALEGGAIANPDEGRMVGHYWLRAPELAPSAAERDAIVAAREASADLVRRVNDGTLAPERGGRFDHTAVIGIGGSSLGPMLVCDALAPAWPIRFLDNTDPGGLDDAIASLPLETTLTVVISKSGGTKETRNGMIEMAETYRRAGLSFAKHAVAITGEDSQLDRVAREEGWLARLPMWDWIGGRTSVTSAVGLVPAGLAGVDVAALLEGARTMDARTREEGPNPAALLAAAWHLAGEGRGRRHMVMLPYKDRLSLVSRYLQQLVMESLGKRESLAGEVVHQGLTVFGNKGSTDQHAYVQQLLDGPDDFFATFIEVLRDRECPSLEVEPGVTSGDYLSGFLQGTRRALADRGRRSLTLTLPRVDARTMGALIALYERAVGIYATLVGINAYHQPGVESGKRAASEVLALQERLLEALGDAPESAEALAAAAGSDDVYTAFTILRHLAANDRARAEGGPEPATTRFAR
jgi:glucose-6-phosphate isomerase